MIQNRLIVVAGPTASGKTGLAVQIAQKLNTEIINCDSRQLYQELNIGVARPAKQELEAVHHHFVAEYSIFSPVSAGTFAAEARKRVAKIIEEKGVAVICGGTGLYLNALIHGFDDMPQTDEGIRHEINELFKHQGIEGLIHSIARLDPQAINAEMEQNPARLKRALELLRLAPGKKLSELRKRQGTTLPYPTHIFCIEHRKENLYSRINDRVDNMVKDGLKAEALELYPHQHLPVLKTVGYTEYFKHFQGELSEEKCVDLIKQHTRNYAKRQVTWFKNQTPAIWVRAEQAIDGIFAVLNND